MKMQKEILVILILCFIFRLSYGQGFTEAQVDSLRVHVMKSKVANDEQGALLAIEKLVLYYSKAQIDSMGVWAEKGIRFSESAGDDYKRALFTNYQGKYYFLKSDYANARLSYRTVRKIDDSPKIVAKSNEGLALSYLYSSHPDSVVFYGLQAEKTYQEIGDTLHRINNLFSLYQSQNQLGNLAGSKQYLDAAKEVIVSKKVDKFYGTMYMNYGVYYMTAADKTVNRDSIQRLSRLDSAYYYYNKGYSDYKSNGIKQYMAIAKYNIAQVDERRNDWKSALDNYTIGRNLIAGFNNPGSIRRFESQILSVLVQMGDAENAIPLFMKDVEYYKEVGDYQKLVDSYMELSKAYEKLGNWKEAYKYKNIQVNTKMETIDSISIIKIAELETKYNTAQKEKQISEQELELVQSNLKSRMLVGIVFATFLLGGMLIWFMKRQSKIKTALQASEIQSLKKENKIIAMHGVISGQEEERKRIAQDLHDNIGSLMSTIKLKVLDIQKSIVDVQKMNIAGEIDDMVSKASSEIRRISHNMTPVAMDLTGVRGAIEDLGIQLQANGIASDIMLDDIEEIMNKEKEVVIYRIIQELVNNIGKHAGARQVKIRTVVENQNLILTVSDDGVGMKLDDWENGNGLGVKSIKSRIDYLEGTIVMDNKKGTAFIIEIPI